MGVINVTPDSFSDGGRFAAVEAALAGARQMIEDGVDIIDIGGESTRPGAQAVPPEVELGRVLPVLRALQGLEVPVSVDTSAPQVMQAALDSGVAIINDVRSLRVPGAMETVRDSDCGVVLMHMPGEPATMQEHARYDDVVSEVESWLVQRRAQLLAAGFGAARIAVDPGFGFGKKRAHNLALLAGLERFTQMGAPLLVGLSRKSTLGELTQRPVAERLGASLGAALMAVDNGANIVRVHDVGATRDALAVWMAVRDHSSPKGNMKEAN